MSDKSTPTNRRKLSDTDIETIDAHTPIEPKRQRYDGNSLDNFCNNINLDDDSYCDFSFVVGPTSEEYKIVNVLFATQSDAFKNMIYGHKNISCQETIEKKAIIDDITCDAFEYIRDTFYFMNPPIKPESLMDIYHASNKYCIQAIKEKCKEFMKKEITTIDTLFAIIEASKKYNPNAFDDIIDTIFSNEFVSQSKTFNAIVESDQFGTVFNCPYILLLLKYTQIKYNDEKIKFEACLKWYNENEDLGPKADILQPILEVIDFRKIDESYLFNNVQTSHVMSDKEFITLMQDRLKTSVVCFEALMLNQTQLDDLKVGDQVDLRYEDGLYYLANILRRIEKNNRKQIELEIEKLAENAIVRVDRPYPMMVKAKSLSNGHCNCECVADHSWCRIGKFVYFNPKYQTKYYKRARDKWYMGKVVECNIESNHELCTVKVDWIEGSNLSLYFYVDNPKEVKPISYDDACWCIEHAADPEHVVQSLKDSIHSVFNHTISP